MSRPLESSTQLGRQLPRPAPPGQAATAEGTMKYPSRLLRISAIRTVPRGAVDIAKLRAASLAS
jgi:hypothetical protein